MDQSRGVYGYGTSQYGDDGIDGYGRRRNNFGPSNRNSGRDEFSYAGRKIYNGKDFINKVV